MLESIYLTTKALLNIQIEVIHEPFGAVIGFLAVLRRNKTKRSDLRDFRQSLKHIVNCLMRFGGYEYLLTLLCKLCRDLGDNLRFACSGRALQKEDALTCQSSSYRKLLRIVKAFKTPFGFFENRTACARKCRRCKQIGGKIGVLYITAEEGAKGFFLTLNLCLFCTVVIGEVTNLGAFEFFRHILDAVVGILGTEVYLVTTNCFVFSFFGNLAIRFLAKGLFRSFLFFFNCCSILNFELFFLFCSCFFNILLKSNSKTLFLTFNSASISCFVIYDNRDHRHNRFELFFHFCRQSFDFGIYPGNLIGMFLFLEL